MSPCADNYHSHAVAEIVSQHFHLRKAEEHMDSVDVARIFKKARAEGKQIWYFSTPASLPIEVIQEHVIPLAKIQTGQPILSHGGDDFTAAFEDAGMAHTVQVLIPAKGTDYEKCMSEPSRVRELPLT
jgi:DNA-directed RNA polymerase I subunit RPA34.5